MNKQSFNKIINNIDVPKDAVFSSIDKGLHQRHKNKKSYKVASLFAIFLLGGTLVAFAITTKVMDIKGTREENLSSSVTSNSQDKNTQETIEDDTSQNVETSKTPSNTDSSGETSKDTTYSVADSSDEKIESSSNDLKDNIIEEESYIFSKIACLVNYYEDFKELTDASDSIIKARVLSC